MMFGEKLKLLRNSKKLSQMQLATLIDVKHNSVSDWEHNRHYPDVHIILKLCDILETTPNYLITDIEVEENLYNEESIARLLSYYSKLSDKDKETVNQLVESLSKK